MLLSHLIRMNSFSGKNRYSSSVIRNDLVERIELYTKLKLKVQSDAKKSAVTDEVKVK